MDITQHQFGQEEIIQLRAYRDRQRDGRLKIRFLGLLLLSEPLPIEQVASVIGRSVKTLKNWGHQYLTKGIECLNSFNYKPKRAYLTPSQCEQLATWVRQTNPAKTKHVKAYIFEQFTVKYTVEAVRQLLHRHGLKRLRPKVVPGKTPTKEAQRAFVMGYEAMKGAYAEGTVFLFVDAMHLVHQNEPGYCWGDPAHPPVIETNSGRKRLNILGGYNPAAHSLIHLTGEENCNAERVVEFFELIVTRESTAPYIVVFADNAKYFKANRVTEWLDAHPQVHLESLPAYAPNLNLIERFWKFTKAHLVKNTYYEHYKTFRAHVFRFLNHVDVHVEELQTLMVEKFQIIQPKTA
jgi:transposase